MAFNIDYLARVSSSANTQALSVWTYNATATGANETQATIAGSGYFNAAQQSLVSGSEAGLFVVGDIILLNGNNTNAMVAVAGRTTNVTVAVY